MIDQYGGIPIALAGGRAAPEPDALIAAKSASAQFQSWRTRIEQPLFEHYQAYVEGFRAEEMSSASEPFQAITSSSENSLDDLVQAVIRQIDQPTAIVAQSMGGILAVHAALQKPELVTHLVLNVTSGGVDMERFGAADWRSAFAAANPHLPDWFIGHRSDLSEQLKALKQPVLLLWGDADPISPVAVGRRLRELLPNARLHVVAGGGHDMGESHAVQLAPLVDDHLQRQI
jgi:pimeloyl-ACP methyl ester carboxylesterase